MTGPGVIRLGISDLEHRLGVERSTIWRWYRAGRFPAPEYLCDRRVWRVDEIERWEAERLARPPEVRRGARNLVHAGKGAAS